MSEFVKIAIEIFSVFGNEFTTQLLIVAAIFIPAIKRRKLFVLRYLACNAVIIGLQLLKRFGYFPVPDPVNYIIVFIMLSATVGISYETNVVQALFLGVCIYGSQHIMSNLSYALVYFIMYVGKSFDLFAYHYVCMIPMTAVGLVATYFVIVRRIKRIGELKFKNISILYTIVAFIIVATTLTHYARNEIWWSLKGMIYLLIIAALFTASILLMAFMNIAQRHLEDENAVLQELLRQDKRRYEQAKLANEKIQIKYHDMKKHMHQGIVDYEGLKELEPDSEIVNSMFFTGSRALDVILSEKAMLCERLGIRFICTADGESVSFMKSHHIYSLVSNALENAIESLKGEKDESNKEITVNIVRRESTCIFKTVNFVRNDVVIQNGLPVTSKDDKENHGFGVKSMKNVVSTYGGNISFFIENNTFTMLAEIPIP